MSITDDKHMSEADHAAGRRLEIFTGAGRRRSWSADDKAAIVAESYAGAISACDVARRHALFAESDGGVETWAAIASLIECCKLIDVEPNSYLPDVITKIVNGHLNSRLDELLPWAYRAAQPRTDVV